MNHGPSFSRPGRDGPTPYNRDFCCEKGNVCRRSSRHYAQGSRFVDACACAYACLRLLLGHEGDVCVDPHRASSVVFRLRSRHLSVDGSSTDSWNGASSSSLAFHLSRAASRVCAPFSLSAVYRLQRTTRSHCRKENDVFSISQIFSALACWKNVGKVYIRVKE